MKQLIVLALTCIFVFSVSGLSQTRHRATQKKSTTTFAEKQQAEIQAGRQQIAAQVKTLTQFLYLLGSVAKGIEIAERAKGNREESIAAMSPEQIAQSKAKLRESIASVRTGLQKLESSFRLNPVLQTYYPSVDGVAKLGQSADTQAAAGNFDQAGRTLITSVSKLTDALIAIH